MAANADPLASYKSLTGAPPATGGGSGGSGLQPQSVAGSNDSLTAFFRSLTNLTGGAGAGQFGAGGVTTGAGLGTVGAGLGTLDTSLKTLSAPQDFYTKLLSGDPAAMTAALAPTASLIGQQNANLQTSTSQNTPQGGFRSTVLAGLPFAQEAQVGNAALGLQNQAAQGLSNIAGQQAQVGGAQTTAGLGTAGVGTTQSQQGLEALFQTIQALLGKMNINQTGSLPNMFNAVSQGIGALV